MVVMLLVHLVQPSIVTNAIPLVILERHVGSYMVLHPVVVEVVLDSLEGEEVVLGGVEVALGDEEVVLMLTTQRLLIP